LVEVVKGYDGRRPLTTCALTRPGRARFRAYLAELEQVIRDASGKAEADAGRSPGWAPA
jgi:hypothetical protein